MVLPFEDVRRFRVAYSEYEQLMRITNQDGGDRVFVRRRELVALATQRMVAYEFYDGKSWSSSSRRSYNKGSKRLPVLMSSR